MAWTIDSVRAELPDVEVRMGKTIYHGQVSGRLEPFASVTIQGKSLRGIAFPWHTTFQYAWNTIVHSLNTGKPLTT